jgi:hypothetical protein
VRQREGRHDDRVKEILAVRADEDISASLQRSGIQDKKEMQLCVKRSDCSTGTASYQFKEQHIAFLDGLLASKERGFFPYR